jgi:type III restriction enzyme
MDGAVFIDTLPEVKFWVRNPVKSPKAFSLQTSTDRFYPDFVCLLHDGRRLVVEYKSERDWSNDDSKEKRDLGELWEARSGGDCLFVMTRGKNLDSIRERITRR